MLHTTRTETLERRIAATHPAALEATEVRVLQVNVGLRCDLACRHCHQSASPARTESMSAGTFAGVVSLARELRPDLVDITGGAPELHPDIRSMLVTLTSSGRAVQLRTNCTAPATAGLEDLPEVFAECGVRLLATIHAPATEDGTWRRDAVYRRSVATLRQLNALGYGRDPTLRLDVVCDRGASGVPDPDEPHEARLREQLAADGVGFGELVVVTGTPVGRLAAALRRTGGLADYRRTLSGAFNPATLPLLACRHQLEVAWDGTLWDCDYNLAAGVPPAAGEPRHLHELDATRAVPRRIAFGRHCWSCTAGSGSS